MALFKGNGRGEQLEIGQPVWVIRTGEPTLKATVTSVMTLYGASKDSRVEISVEWLGQSGEVLSKTVPAEDVLPRKQDAPLSQQGCPNPLPLTQPPGVSDDNPTPTASPSQCDFCGQSFKNKRGLNTHISKKHPIEANQIKIAKLLKEKSPPHSPPCNNIDTKQELERWAGRFKDFLNRRSLLDLSNFDEAVNDFLKFLRKLHHTLPGPKHPAVRYFQQRQKDKRKIANKGNKQVSNPIRANKAARERRRDAYLYELAQYQYYNRRKNVVNTVMNAGVPKTCPITLNELETHFSNSLGCPNELLRESYGKAQTKHNITSIKLQSIHRAIKSTSIDTSPGPDGVLIRTIKSFDVAYIIKLIADIMLKTAHVPLPFRKGRTVLIYKGKGSLDSVSSWRPITVFSILRRIIEKVFDEELRNQARFHRCQRGFVRGMPGCHVNARLIDSVVKDAKANKKNAVVAFLDITGAFDNVGHSHVIRTLEERGISSDLKNITSSLLTGNSINISVGGKKSSDIPVCRGVPQGSPLSPTLFNLAIDFLFREVCDSRLAETLGFKWENAPEPIILTGFADDIAVTVNSVRSAERTIGMVRRLIREIGLEINPIKTTAMVLIDGMLGANKLDFDSGESVTSIGTEESIKYLGCTFSGELCVNQSSVRTLHDNLARLEASNLLKPDQKLNILNQYIFPMLVYPLQSAPLIKLRPSFLEGVDVVIRRTVKAIIGLPANTTSAMLYAPRKYRGLALIRSEWEAPLQHLSIAQKLAKVPDVQFQRIFNYEAESEACLSRLSTEVTEFQNGLASVRGIRKSLREGAFDQWKSCRWQGIGVHHFKENPLSNKFVYDKESLSGGEWTNALKLSVNYAPLRAVPGVVSQVAGDVGPLCRRCGRENETPAHVLGSCPNNMLLVTRRHHRVKHAIQDLLKSQGFSCFDEVHAVDSNGSTRFVDIVAFHDSSDLAYILDPTVRFESNESDQADIVAAEKFEIYSKCINYIQEKYLESFGNRKFVVKGLWFGSRGTIPHLTMNFLTSIGADRAFISRLAEEILIDSLSIIHHHIYS